jgi:hypothetical protein
MIPYTFKLSGSAHCIGDKHIQKTFSNFPGRLLLVELRTGSMNEGFEFLTEVVMKSSVFWDIVLYHLLKISVFL